MTETPPPYDTPRKRGRPPTGEAKVMLSFRIRRDVAEFLKTVDNQSEFIEGLVRKSKAFKDRK